MANDLASFSEKIKKAALNIERNAVEIQKDIAMHVLAEVATRTPVDTGRAISNWLVNSNSPATHKLEEALVPGEKASTQSANIELATALGDDAIRAHRKGDLHITNNLDYIGALNDGTLSKQAPAHFVQIAALSATKSGIKRSIIDSTPGGSIA